MQAWLTNAAHGYWQSDWIHLLSLSDSSFGAKQGKRRGTRVSAEVEITNTATAHDLYVKLIPGIFLRSSVLG